MHISEGVLSPMVLGAGYALSLVPTAIGLRKMDYDQVMTVALLSAVFFVGSLIHVPLGPGSVHLLLNGLVGLLLGWACFPAITAALILQGVMLQFGGLSTLGVNLFTMAFPALTCGLIFRRFLFTSPRQRFLASFGAGFTAVLLSSLLMASALTFTDQGFLATARLIVAAHLPVMVIEGVVTAFVVSFLARVQPEMLMNITRTKERKA